MSSLPESVERVARELRDDILRSRYRPGDRLPSERELAERLSVNRGAVREALRSLAQLGILEIGPGGARAASVEDASLEVVGHLLALEELPEPDLVSQVIEAHGVLVAGWFRMLIERNDDAEISEALSLLHAVAKGALETLALHELSNQLMDRSPNLVLRLMRKGMQLHFVSGLIESGVEIEPSPELLQPLAPKLIAAVEARDGSAAADLVHDMIKLNQERALRGLEQARARSGSVAVSDSPIAMRIRANSQRPLED